MSHQISVQSSVTFSHSKLIRSLNLQNKQTNLHLCYKGTMNVYRHLPQKPTLRSIVMNIQTFFTRRSCQVMLLLIILPLIAINKMITPVQLTVVIVYLIPLNTNLPCYVVGR